MITIEIVLKILKELKLETAPGLDNFVSLFFYEVANEIADIIVILYKKSIETITIPQEWLQAITVIFKKGKKSLPGNYRPVSLTCIFCKCLEKIIRRSMDSYQKGRWTYNYQMFQKSGQMLQITGMKSIAFIRISRRRLIQYHREGQWNKWDNIGQFNRYVNRQKHF